MVADHFGNDEVQELARELGIEVGILGQALQARDLHALARRVRWRQPVVRLEDAHRLRVLEALGQGEDQDGIQPVDRFAVAAQQVGGAADGVGLGHRHASGPGCRNTRSQGKSGVAVLSSAHPRRRATASERSLSGLT